MHGRTGMERATTIDFTKARAQATVIATAINHEGTPHPNFARASQNVVVAVALLDSLPVCNVPPLRKDG
jgi:hypothetical protein